MCACMHENKGSSGINEKMRVEFWDEEKEKREREKRDKENGGER